MQDTFARATHSAGQARRATIGYLVYKVLTGGNICNTATQRARLLLMNLKVFIFVLAKIGVSHIRASYYFRNSYHIYF